MSESKQYHLYERRIAAAVLAAHKSGALERAKTAVRFGYVSDLLRRHGIDFSTANPDRAAIQRIIDEVNADAD
jgi:hypothetical protein